MGQSECSATRKYGSLNTIVIWGMYRDGACPGQRNSSDLGNVNYILFVKPALFP